MPSLRALTISAIVAFLTACSSRKLPPPAYQLRGLHVLPPVGSKPEIPSARSGRKNGCDVSGEAFALKWKGRKAIVQTLGLEMEEAGRMPLSVLRAIDDFREALARLESNGCLKPGEATALLTRLAAQLALPSAVAYELAHASSPVQGYVDVEHPFQLKLVSALRTNGQISGFEITRYAVKLGRVTAIGSGGAGTRLAVPAGTRYLRLFFLLRRSPADHDAILVTAPDSTTLAEATAGIRQQGEQYCRASKQLCITVPREVGLSAELPIRANGKMVGVPVRGTISDALKEAGVRDPATVLKSLRVTRPYNGKPIPIQFDASRRDILSLVLIGGEELNWQ